VEAVREITDLINERRTRAMLVASSIYRHAEESEIEQRKTAYDEVFVRWNSKAQSVALRIREMFKQTAPEIDYESYFNALTHETLLGSRSKSSTGKVGLLTIMDQCITDAFDRYRQDGFLDSSNAKVILSQCETGTYRLDIDALNFELIHCTIVLGDSLFFVVNTSDLPNFEEKIHEDSKSIKDACTPQPAT
jgi:hypothetical protein